MPNSPRDAAINGFTDYWLNTNIAGQRNRALKSPEIVLMAGDGNDGLDLTNARYSRSNLPPVWLSANSNPFNRHEGGGYFLFADGHVKWLHPGEIVDNPASSTKATFAIK
jgi:prepilin-type processing-associated H-X9-DG protein